MEFWTLPPHVVNGITATYGTAEGRQYLIDLMTYKVDATRPQGRKGFSRMQLTELLKTLEQHDEKYPEFIRDGLLAQHGTIVFYSDVK